MPELEQRPRFYEGQFLQAADLTEAVAYARSQLARTQLAGHTWGIAEGLEIVDTTAEGGGIQPVITPGYAWDGFGRAIVVTDRVNISSALFSQFDAGALGGDPVISVEVWLRFREDMTDPPKSGFQLCEGDDEAFARVIESYRVEVGPKTGSSLRSAIAIGGQSFDAALALSTFGETTEALTDASVPHQDFPKNANSSFWPIPIGIVCWQPGSPGNFVARTGSFIDAHKLARRHCGVVAESIEATAGHLRIHNRLTPDNKDLTNELLWVDGESRFDGHVRLYASRIEFSSTHSEKVSPFRFLRSDSAVDGAKKIQIAIGDQGDGLNCLAIGPETGTGTNLYAEHVVVTDNGKVGVGLSTTTPKARLHLKEGGGFQIGEDSSVATNNFYVDVDANGTRALRFYCGDYGAGTPVATFAFDGKVGFGATAPTNQLEVVGALGIKQNKMYFSGEGNWHSLSFNAHHDSANGAWVFPDVANPCMTIEMDNQNNFSRLEIRSTTTWAKQTWISRFFINGDSGNVVMAANGGNVGVGTANPQSKLDVIGSVRSTGDVTFSNNSLHAMGAISSLMVVWGTISSLQVIEAGEGFAFTRQGPGRYLITFTTPFASLPAASVTRIHQSTTNSHGTSVTPLENAIIDQLTTNQMVVCTGDVAGALDDGGFTFIVTGPR